MMNLTVFGMPKLQENLGQLRGIGAGVATKGSFDTNSFVMASTLNSKIKNDLDLIRLEFEILSNLSSHYVPEELRHVINAVEAFQITTKNKLLDPDTPSISGSEYFSMGTDAIQKVVSLDKALNIVYLATLKKDKDDRVSSMIVSLGTFAILFLIACYLFICLRIAIDLNVGIAQRMADDLEDGVLNQEYLSKSQD
jgi:methyl-accepting chemotaxis protein